MSYQDLREFISDLERRGALKRVAQNVSPYLEITAFCDAVLKKGGPALLFENPTNSKIPVLANLFGTPERVAWGLNAESVSALKDVGKTLAALKEPAPPEGLKDAWRQIPIYKKALAMRPKKVKNAPCHEVVLSGDDVDLTQFPIQHCWPGDAAPLITWGIVVTKGPFKKRQNLGIYRQQLLGKNRLIMRWLAHRGGALDFEDFKKTNPGERFPVSVVIGCDPATLLSAVTPIPDSLSEYQFAGLLRGAPTELTKCLTNDLTVPARAEIVLEGFIDPAETAAEGPFGDHTGYYNEVAEFPVFTVEKITHRRNPIYLSTYTGKPPDEPCALSVALNDVFVPLLQKQFPEITDFYLPPEGCSYRLAIVAIKKEYPGHAKRVMFGVWSFLRQFMYTKFIIVVDEDVNIRTWSDVIWALTTRVDAARDTTIIENTPIDYLDFASPVAGLGSKMGIDATNKWQGETQREWGSIIEQKPEIINKINALLKELNL